MNKCDSSHVPVVLGTSGISKIFSITLFSFFQDSITTFRLKSIVKDTFVIITATLGGISILKLAHIWYQAVST